MIDMTCEVITTITWKVKNKLYEKKLYLWHGLSSTAKEKGTN